MRRGPARGVGQEWGWVCGSHQKVSDAESVEQAGCSPGPGRKARSGAWGQAERAAPPPKARAG